MANQSRKVEVTEAELPWIVKALDHLRTQLVRAKMKEIPGTEVHQARGRQIDQIAIIMQKFS